MTAVNQLLAENELLLSSHNGLILLHNSLAQLHGALRESQDLLLSEHLKLRRRFIRSEIVTTAVLGLTIASLWIHILWP